MNIGIKEIEQIEKFSTLRNKGLQHSELLKLLCLKSWGSKLNNSFKLCHTKA